MWTIMFWKATCERAIKTVAQGVVALIGVDVVVPVGSIDWRYILGAAATMGVLSVLTSIASNPLADQGTPSLVKGGE